MGIFYSKTKVYVSFMTNKEGNREKRCTQYSERWKAPLFLFGKKIEMSIIPMKIGLRN
jgi:hypothetical protein